MGLVKSYGTWTFRHSSSYLDYFKETIKLTISNKCVIVILRVLKIKLLKMPQKSQSILTY